MAEMRLSERVTFSSLFCVAKEVGGHQGRLPLDKTRHAGNNLSSGDFLAFTLWSMGKMLSEPPGILMCSTLSDHREKLLCRHIACEASSSHNTSMGLVGYINDRHCSFIYPAAFASRPAVWTGGLSAAP